MPSDRFLPTAISRPTAPQLNKLYLRTPYLYKTGFPVKPKENYLFDYNNPYEENSLLDVFVNSFDTDNFLKHMVDGGWDLFKRGTVDPIRAGHYGTAALNNLMGFAETLDVVAGPTKALLQGRGMEDAKKAWGIGTHGRYNYDWDTGNLFGDIMMEVLFDPINWVTLGLKGAVTGAAKGTLKTALKNADHIAQFAEPAVYKKVTRQLVDAYLKEDTELMAKQATRVIRSLEKSGKIKLLEGNTVEDVVKVLQKAEAVAKESPGYTINKSLYKLVGGVETFEKGLFRAALTPSGLYPSWWLAKQGYTKASKMIEARIQDVLKHYSRPDGTMSASVFREAVQSVKDINDVFGKLTEIRDGVEDIPREVIFKLQQGVRKDVVNLTSIMKDARNDLALMEQQLQEYMMKMNGTSSMKEYLAMLDEVDVLMKGEFHWAAEEFRNLMKYREALHKREAYRFAHTEGKQSKEYLTEVFSRRVEEFDLYLSPKYTKLFLEEKGFYQYLRQQIQDFRTPERKWLTPKGQRSLLKEAMEKLEADGYFAPLRETIEKYIAELPTTLQKSVREGYEGALSLTRRDIRKQLAEYLYAVGAASKTKVPYTEPLELRFSQEYFEKAHKRMINYMAKLETNNKYLQDTIKEFESSQIFMDLINTPADTAKVGKVVDTLMNSTYAVNKYKEDRIVPNAHKAQRQYLQAKVAVKRYLKAAAPEDDPYVNELIARFMDVKPAIKDPLSQTSHILNPEYSEAYYAMQRWLLREQAALKEDLAKFQPGVDVFDWDWELKARKYKYFKPEKGDSVPKLEYSDMEKTMQAASNDLRRAIERLEAITPPRISDVLLDRNQAAKWVTLKTESAFVQLNLSVLGPVGDFMRALQAPENMVGNYIQTLAKLGEYTGPHADELLLVRDSAAELLRIAQFSSVYSDTLAKLAAVPDVLHENYRNAFVSTIQSEKFKKMDPSYFLPGSKVMDEFFDQMELNMRSLYDNDRYNLEAVRAYIDDWGKGLDDAVKKKILSDAHTADADAYTLAMYMMTVHKAEVQKHLDENKLVYFIDIETTGLSHNNGTILEIAGSTPGGQTFCFTRNLTQEEADKIDDDLLAVLFGDLPIDERRAAFQKRYVRPGDPTSEEQILQAYLNEVTAIPAGMPKDTGLVLYAHNGKQFDFDFLRNRMYSSNVDIQLPQRYTNAEAIDTMKIMMGSKTEVNLTDDARTLLAEALESHGFRMEQLGSTRMVHNGAAEALNHLRDLQLHLSKDAVAIRVPHDLQKYHNAVRQELDMAAQNIQTILTDNSKHKGLFRHSWLADPFAGTTTQSRQEAVERIAAEMGITTSEVVQRFGYNAEAAEIVYLRMKDSPELFGLAEGATKVEFLDAIHKQFGDNINLPRLLSFGTRRGETVYRNSIILAMTEKYFHLPEQLPGKMLEAWTRIAKRLDTEAESVRNVNLIKELVPEMNRVIAELQAHPELLATNSRIDLFRAMRWDTKDDIKKFVMLKKILKFRKEGETTMYPISGMSDLLAKTLEDPTRVFGKSVYSESTTVYEASINRASTELLDSPGDLIDAVSRMDLKASGLEELSRDLDKGLFSSKMFTVANALRDMTLAMRKMQELSPEERHRLGRELHNIKNDQGTQQIYNLLHDSLQNPGHLLSTLVWEAPFMRISTRNTAKNADILRAARDLIARSGELEELGIKLMEGKDTLYIWLESADTQVREIQDKLRYKKHNIRRTYRGQDIPLPKHRELPPIKNLQGFEEIGELLNKTRTRLHDLSKGRSVGSTGELMTPKRLNEYYLKLPQAVQDSVGDIYRMTADDLWQGLRYDWSNLGTAQMKKVWDPFAHTNVMAALRNSLEYTASLTESKALYLDMYFNSQLSINNGLLSTEGLSKEESDAKDLAIIQALKNNHEFVLAALVESNSKAGDGFRVVKLNVDTVEDMARARKLNATILPYQVYATSHQTLNTSQFSSLVLNLWHKIIYTYKVGYLLDPGVIIRNYVDSLAKNIVSQDGNVAAVARTQAKAMVMLNQYNKALAAILKLGDQKFRYDNLDKFFHKLERLDTNVDMTLEQFQFLHGFIAYSASAGMTGPWQKYLKGQNIGSEDRNLWTTFVAVSDWLMTPNKWTEQINRLTQYMLLEEQGFTKTQIFKQIADTHFDYNVKTLPEMYAELIFPFYTFTKRNLEYWVKAVSTKPWLANMFKDVMTPVWNFDGYTQDELGRNRSLQYQLLSGNIAPFADNGFTIKVNPSFMDVYNMATDIPASTLGALMNGEIGPDSYGSITGKMAAPLQLALDQGWEIQGGMAAGLFDLQATGSDSVFHQVANILPVIGAAKVRFEQGEKYAERSGFDWQKIPLTQGTFGATQRWEPRKTYTKSPYTKKYYGADTSSGFTYRTYHRKYYPSNYPAHGRNLYYDSFYKKHYTKKGVSKMKLRMMPYTPDNLGWRIKDLYWYLR